jgi:hypothetical protein
VGPSDKANFYKHFFAFALYINFADANVFLIQLTISRGNIVYRSHMTCY